MSDMIWEVRVTAKNECKAHWLQFAISWLSDPFAGYLLYSFKG